MVLAPDLVRRVLVVSEDVLGPMRNSLLLELFDGSCVSLDKNREMERFLDSLSSDRPLVAADIRRALRKVADHPIEEGFDLE